VPLLDRDSQVDGEASEFEYAERTVRQRQRPQCADGVRPDPPVAGHHAPSVGSHRRTDNSELLSGRVEYRTDYA
jgi:hypothetical protein